jgi:hypothetical protein
MKYLSYSDIEKLTGKSRSSIQNFRKRTQKEGIENFEGQPIFKKEPLQTGNFKVYMLEDYVKHYFNLNTPQHVGLHTDDTPLNTSKYTPLEADYIETLKNQLEIKDKQLDERDKQINELIQRQREQNILIERANQRIAEIERLFQLNQKKEEVEVFQEVVEQKPKVEFKTTVESKERPLKKFKEVVITEAIKESSRINKEEQKKKNFLDWLNKLQEERK